MVHCIRRDCHGYTAVHAQRTSVSEVSQQQLVGAWRPPANRVCPLLFGRDVNTLVPLWRKSGRKSTHLSQYTRCSRLLYASIPAAFRQRRVQFRMQKVKSTMIKMALQSVLILLYMRVELSVVRIECRCCGSASTNSKFDFTSQSGYEKKVWKSSI